ncbi:transposon ty3-g Gag-Pol polyprotein [Plakobranchus ocellatus]|uniref:Transposon ty3-g Gag-Pol polyprotein n=1 Tax=Plakobranchus ocellatus TaxID=259542 RepID=A0AAV4C3E1_9GAST|nr:transposon ty3-g Gag-Pol polyprotein [Plakobranchus ocellatus]
MPTPTFTSEVRSLLGMMNFCGAHLIPDYATLTYELRRLTQKNTAFKWTERHDEALGFLKSKLKNHITLCYFNPNKDTQVYVDASPVGISAILTQTDEEKPQIVQIASRSLTETEQRYSQTEREALAVTWACEHFHIYLFGAPRFTVYTDRKLLVSLFGSPKIQLPVRIERWVMRTQAYNMAINYKPGKTKTLSMLREKVWFKNMHTAVEQAVKNCFACQVATPTTTREPLQMSDLPQEPWSKLNADFGHLPDGTYLLVVTDEYSRYVVVDTIKSTSARAVIPRFDKIFAEFGIPDELKTDNGPPFNGIDFKTYLEHKGIKHRKITPRWPQANAETERFMRTIKKTIKAAQVEHKNWKQEMFKFLLAYRTTKHSSTGLAPANVLFNRVVKNKLPAAPIQTDPINTWITCNDAAAKAKMKHYADCKSYIKRSDIQIGESVLVKQSDKTKPTTPYEPIPYVVSNKKGSMITAKRHNKSIMRNSRIPRKPFGGITRKPLESLGIPRASLESPLVDLEKHSRNHQI